MNLGGIRKLFDNSTIFKNSFYNIVGQGLPLVIGLVCIPQLINKLGIDRFGLLSLVWIFLGYLAFFDLGLGRAIIKIISEQLGKGNRTAISRFFWTTIWIIFGLSILGSVISLVFAHTIMIEVFKIPDSLREDALHSFYLLSIGIPIITLTAAFRGLLEAEQRFFVINLLQGVSGTITYIVPLIIAIYSQNVSVIILYLVIARFLTLVAHIVVCMNRFPELRKISLPDREALPLLIRFGGWLTVSNLISPLMVYFDRFILGSIIPVGDLAYYTTPYEIITRVLIIPSAVSRVLFPSVSFTLAQNTSSEKLVENAYRLTTLTLLPIIILLISIAKPGMTLWLGQEFGERSSIILQILALGVFFNGIASIPYTLIQSSNRPDLTAKAHIFELPIYAVVLWFMCHNFGTLGAAIAWSFRIVLDLLVLTFLAKKNLKDLSYFLESMNRKYIFLFVYLIAFVLFIHFGDYGSALAFTTLLVIYMWAYFVSFEEKYMIKNFKWMPFKKEAAEPILKDNTAILIVSFNPEPVLKDTIHFLKKQFSRIIIVDNGSDIMGRETLKDIQDAHAAFGVQVIYNKENYGISKALNQGFDIARKDDYKWVLTFDQDSRPHDNYLEMGQDILGSYTHPESVAMITPTLFEEQLKAVIPYNKKPKEKCVTARLAITSGAITRVDSFFAVKGYNESLFIDYVDFDFCFRLRHSGHTILESNALHLNHQLGKSQKHDFLFTNFITTHHNEIRRYYITRNRFYMYKKYFILETDWVIEDFMNFFKDFLKILIAEKQKSAKMKSILMGIRDFSLSRYGKI
ncbi:MAG: oligosaccharide flippase family protein [Bdellovibrionaceae bacterium]|nr:oligosaccharide flippase family protein [Pseudobdellovibrionaceae bacterium]